MRVGAVVAEAGGGHPLTAQRQDLERRAAAVLELQRRRAAHPLAFAELWHAEGWDTSGLNGSPQRLRTSQRAAVGTIAGAVSVAIFGGNGTGKSEVAGQLGAACMLGREHPDVKAWLKRNHLPPELVPPYPGRVLCSALTFAYSRKVVRTKVAKYLPRDVEVVWRNRDGEGEAEVRIPSLQTPGNEGGATIVFKSNDQGADGYQSDEFDVVLNDEEHDEPVFEQELARLDRRIVRGYARWSGGWVAHFATLENGCTWLWEKHENKRVEGYRSYWLHAPDSPYVDLAEKLRKYAGLTPEKRATRLFGVPGGTEGRVYGMFSRAAHVIPPRYIPPEWPRYRSIDFGTRNPFACIWAALDPADDVVHVYRVYYHAGLSTEENGAAVAKLSTDEHYAWTCADPESADGIRTLARKCGIHARKARKAVAEGIATVIEWLNPDADGKPHLVFHDVPDMMPLIREIEGYRYADPVGKADGRENPIKANDHALDALRYLVFLVDRERSASGSVADLGDD